MSNLLPNFQKPINNLFEPDIELQTTDIIDDCSHSKEKTATFSGKSNMTYLRTKYLSRTEIEYVSRRSGTCLLAAIPII